MSEPVDLSTPSETKMEIPAFVVPDSNSYAPRTSKIFKAICEFADQLNDAFGKDDVSINKVYRILMKTSLANRKVVNRHLVVFHEFLTINRIQILGRSHDQFLDAQINVTERIGMNMKDVIEKADEATRGIIWQHLFNIMFLFNPDDQVVKSELKVSISENDTRENKFLKDTFNKFEEVMKTGGDSSQKDPMAMMSGLLQSGFLNDMIGNINNGVNKGDLNIKSLISNVQHLLGNLSDTIDREERAK